MSKRRVVVTGMGMLSPVGNTVESSWKALLAGQSGIVNIEHFDATNFSTRFAGLVKDFNCEEYMTKKDARKFANSMGMSKQWNELMKLKRPDGTSLIEEMGSDVFIKPNWDGEAQ